jgi:hypothetical protein
VRAQHARKTAFWSALERKQAEQATWRRSVVTLHG